MGRAYCASLAGLLRARVAFGLPVWLLWLDVEVMGPVVLPGLAGGLVAGAATGAVFGAPFGRALHARRSLSASAAYRLEVESRGWEIPAGVIDQVDDLDPVERAAGRSLSTRPAGGEL